VEFEPLVAPAERQRPPATVVVVGRQRSAVVVASVVAPIGAAQPGDPVLGVVADNGPAEQEEAEHAKQVEQVGALFF